MGLKNGEFLSLLPVKRPKSEAKRFYDRISRIYDYLSGSFEQKHVNRAISLLSPEEGESVLEIGFGTGHGISNIAGKVGVVGRVVGLDISSGMVRTTMRRLEEASLTRRACLCCGDAGHLPFRDGVFDASFIGFTLELFDTPEIPLVLEEILRVISSHGHLGAVGLSRKGSSMVLRLYEWAHRTWPIYFDCRPIHLEASLRRRGYKIIVSEHHSMMGLPVGIIVSEKNANS